MHLQVPVPAGVADLAWVCQAGGGASCGPGTGTGAIDRTVALPPDALLRFDFVARVLPPTAPRLVFEAHADVALPQRDFRPHDNHPRATSALDPDLLFDDQFESR